MSHCYACQPCCCRACDPWTYFVRSWAGLGIAIRNPPAARWLLGVDA